MKTFDDGTLIIDTRHLQMFSLVAVMQEFGYWFDEDICNFYDPENENVRVSFKSAVELHNNLFEIADDLVFCVEEGRYNFNHFEFNIYQFYRACGAQVVEKVKLQLNKKNKQISCQDDRVLFTVKNYSYIFLPK